MKLAKKHDIPLRQSYAWVGKRALIKYQCYRHAKRFKRVEQEELRLSIYSGCVIRDNEHKIVGNSYDGHTLSALLP